MTNQGMPTLIFKCEFDDQTEFEVEQKGWFEAVAVRLPSGAEISLAFFDPVRLAQELDAEVASGRSCVAEPALIVIPQVTRANMARSVIELYESGYFDALIAIGAKRESPKPDF